MSFDSLISLVCVISFVSLAPQARFLRKQPSRAILALQVKQNWSTICAVIARRAVFHRKGLRPAACAKQAHTTMEPMPACHVFLALYRMRAVHRVHYVLQAVLMQATTHASSALRDKVPQMERQPVPPANQAPTPSKVILSARHAPLAALRPTQK